MIGPVLGATTVNPFRKLATSVFVVTVTVLAPRGAAGAILTTAIATVGLVTVRDATVTPVPNVATLVPCAKWVSKPVIVTARVCAPCVPPPGFNCVSVGVGASTLKTFGTDATSAPVVTVSVLGPTAALGSIAN